MLNIIKTNIEALRVLEIPVDSWDALLIPIVIEKLDYNTNKEWQAKLSKEIPKLNELLEFLDNKCQLLEGLNQTTKHITYQSSTNQKSFSKFKGEKSTTYLNIHNKLCFYCKNSHDIYKCKEFLNLTVDDREKIIKELKLCINCFRSKHFAKDCKSTYTCRQCNAKHNTLLHRKRVEAGTSEISQGTSVGTSNVNVANNKFNALLSTASVLVKDLVGTYHKCRALLDMGSQSNLLTENFARKLKLPTKISNIPVIGINNLSSNINKSMKISIKASNSDYKEDLDCLIIKTITNNIPAVSFNTNHFSKNIDFADPEFNKSIPVDLLLGAEIFWNILKTENIKAKCGNPHFQNTKLGWIVGGQISNTKQVSSRCQLVINSSTADLQKQVAKLFWEIDEPVNKNIWSPEENLCEIHYKNTVKRGLDGRFIVNLPFRNDSELNLGNSKQNAYKRFCSLETRLNKNPSLKLAYSDFIKEHKDLDHLELVNCNHNESEYNTFYLPHHGVFKESSITTKLRVVFDASCKSSSGVSLNDKLMIGPNIQQDLLSIILRFRIHKFVISADVTKMYRQILVDPIQRDYQRIVWRNSKTETLDTYRLKTVTYGTASASWLAIRTLHELADRESQLHPLACHIIKTDFYMDDLLTGCDNLKDAINLRDELITVMKSGKFELNKWSSNNSKFLPNAEIINSTSILNLDRDNEIKVLGLVWNSKQDSLNYTLKSIEREDNITKRHILSVLAKIFDPLGLISPVLTRIKILIQKLWILNLTWDQPVPHIIKTEWLQFICELHTLNNLKIPRHVIGNNTINDYELHGFCDASQEAYGAAIYIRSCQQDGEYHIQLMCAKSRVAPIKALTIPRLELCGALLLARLINKVSNALNLKFKKRYLWTDSSIVLAWIAASPGSWQTFVANRVAEIQQLTDKSEWLHIKSEYNPADVLSRGTTPKELIATRLWWNPDWLKLDSSMWPKSKINILSDIPEKRKSVNCSNLVVNNELDVFLKFSSFNKLQRVIPYVLRFVNNCRNQTNCIYNQILNQDELDNANQVILKYIQTKAFNKEMTELIKTNTVNKQSKLFTLSPFLDKNKLIRVGGRLKNSNLNYNTKHPIVLPANDHITKLLMIREHERHLHAGAQSTLYALRENFWPLSARNTIRKIIHNCYKCFRVNPTSKDQKMTDLPVSRVVPSRPFLVSGVDYAGPIIIKQASGRCKKTSKVYIALFICFATKALHLELVSDCTTESFLAALNRFIARRGRIKQLYSDNAKNFVGANTELIKFKEILNSNSLYDTIIKQGISWNFIPANSPHRGGLWEAGVKQVKKHLYRTIGKTLLTFEELYTLLSQIEACLNSRPLYPLTQDPNDMQPLSPGHFLIGDRMTAYPEPDLTDIQANRLSRWQHVQYMKQHFWKRWQREYLTSLQLHL